MGGTASRPLSDANLPADGAPAPPFATVSTELVLTGTPVQGQRKAAGPLGDDSCATLDDFTWAEGSAVDLREILRASPGLVTPYCFDHLRRRVILTKVDPAEMGTRTFLYKDQRQMATNVYAVPYSEFCDIVDEFDGDAAWMGKVTFLHSTGRCGSTLLCKLLGQANGMISLSEPDIYTYLGFLQVMHGDDFASGMLGRLARSVTWMHYAAAAGDTGADICIKTRSQVIAVADLIKRAIPDSKNIYLYRAPIPTIDSFCMAFASNFIARMIRWLNIDGWYFYSKYSGLVPSFPYMCPWLASPDPRFPADIYRPLGLVGLTALMFIYNMERAVALQKVGTFDAVLRYEDLCSQREVAVKTVLEECGNKDAIGLEDASAIFDEDAHKGNATTASSRAKGDKSKKPLYISETDLPFVEQLLVGHKQLKDLGYIIPGTLTF
jgi:hypothetical protein